MVIIIARVRLLLFGARSILSLRFLAACPPYPQQISTIKALQAEISNHQSLPGSHYNTPRDPEESQEDEILRVYTIMHW
jgi:hypothetical protein